MGISWEVAGGKLVGSGWGGGYGLWGGLFVGYEIKLVDSHFWGMIIK